MEAVREPMALDHQDFLHSVPDSTPQRGNRRAPEDAHESTPPQVDFPAVDEAGPISTKEPSEDYTRTPVQPSKLKWPAELQTDPHLADDVVTPQTAQALSNGWHPAVIDEHRAVARAEAGLAEPPEAPSPDQPTPSPRPALMWTGRTVPRTPKFATSARLGEATSGLTATPARIPKSKLKATPNEPATENPPHHGFTTEKIAEWTGKTRPVSTNLYHSSSRTKVSDQTTKDDVAQKQKPVWTGRTKPCSPPLQTKTRVRAQASTTSESYDRRLASLASQAARKNWKGATTPFEPKLHTNTRMSLHPKPRDPIYSLPPEERELEELRRAKIQSEKDKRQKQALVHRMSMSTSAAPKPVELTIPRSPHLHTNTRGALKQTKVLSSMEQEELEAKKKFVAHPLNRKVLEPPVMAPRPVPDLTVPISPTFRINHRSTEEPAKVEPSPDKPKVNWTGKTKINPPRLSISNKAPTARPAVSTEFKALPLPVFNKHEGFVSVANRDEPITKPVPFRLSMSNAPLKTPAEEHRSPAKAFKARPMPDFDAFDHSQADATQKPRESTGRPKFTQPKPFSLESSRIVAEQEAKLASLRESEEQKERSVRHFVARPMPDPDHVFIPEKLQSPVLKETQNITLHSDRRATERESWELSMREKQRLLEEGEQEGERRRSEQEASDLKDYRKSLTFRAHPVPYSAN